MKAKTRFMTAWGKLEKAADGACIAGYDATTIGATVAGDGIVDIGDALVVADFDVGLRQ